MRTINDICYSEEKDNIRLLDICLPDTDAKDVFVYFHGGGLGSGSKDVNAPFIKYLCDNGIGVVTANYRLYPNAKYPDYIEDAAECVSWVVKHIKEYTPAKRIFIGGSSAGGYLSLMLCFDGRYLEKYGLSPTDFAGYIHNAGQPTTHFSVLSERGFNSWRAVIDEAAPIYYVGTSEKYAPMLFIVSDNDMNCRYEQTLLTIATMKQFGKADGVSLKVINGGHCEQDYRNNADGVNEFGAIALEYIKSVK